MLETLILIILLAVLFDISNGWNDSANAIATVVSTKVLSPMSAVVLAAVMNIAGAFLTTAVAKTIGGGIVDPKAVTDAVVMAALLSAFCLERPHDVRGPAGERLPRPRGRARGGPPWPTAARRS